MSQSLADKAKRIREIVEGVGDQSIVPQVGKARNKFYAQFEGLGTYKKATPSLMSRKFSITDEREKLRVFAAD